MTKIFSLRTVDGCRASLAGLGMALLAACGAPGRGSADEYRESQISLSSQLSDGLSLEGFALRPILHTSDSVYVGYVLRNGGTARRLVLDPRFFDIQVIGPNGHSEPRTTESWTGSTGDESVVFLPHLGMVGRIFALPCGNPGFSVIETCDDGRSSLAPGDYRVVLTYSPPPPPGSQAEAISLTSDTIRLRVDSP